MTYKELREIIPKIKTNDFGITEVRGDVFIHVCNNSQFNIWTKRRRITSFVFYDDIVYIYYGYDCLIKTDPILERSYEDRITPALEKLILSVI